MKKITITLTLIMGLISLVNAQTKKVFLPYLEAININKEFQISSTKLLKNYIDLANNFQVVMDGNKEILFDADKSNEELKSKAQELDAAYFIKGALNRVGENVIVNVSLFETATGNKVWFDQLKAASPDDLDPIMQRIGNTIGSQNKATAVDDIYSVTNQESVALKQKQTNNSFGVGLGGLQPFGSGPQLTVLGLGWYFDSRNFIFDIRPTLAVGNSNSTILSSALEIFKPHNNNASSPFYGGGASYSISNIYGRSGQGLNLIIGGGYLINRTSAVSMRIGANFFYGLYNITSTNVSYNSGTGTYTYSDITTQSPYGAELKIEVLFRR